MRFTTILTAAMSAFTLANGSPVANATSALTARGLKGGYYNDRQCYLKGNFIPFMKSPYGIYGDAQCPPGQTTKRWETSLDLNKCLLNQNGQLKWLP